MWTRAWCDMPNARAADRGDERCRLSVIVALHNEADNVVGLLRSVAEQTVVPDEVIMVCDHCTDDTQRQIAAYVEANGLHHIRVIQNGGERGKKYAQRAGVELASNEYVAVTDADCKLPARWVEAIEDALCEHPDMIIAPVKMVANDNRITQRLMELEFLSLQMVTAGSAIRQRATMCNGANMIFRRSMYLSHDGNNQYISGDDMFLLSEVKRKGGVVAYLKDADAVVSTTCPCDVKAYYKQRTRWLRKSTGYTDRDVKLLSLIVFMGNASWPVALVCGLLMNGVCWPAVLCLVLKTMSEMTMISKACGFWSVRRRLGDVALLAVVYPYVLLSIAVATMVRSKSKW